MSLVLILVLVKKLSVKFISFLDMEYISVEIRSIKVLFLETKALAGLGLKEVKITRLLLEMVRIALEDILVIIILLV